IIVISIHVQNLEAVNGEETAEDAFLETSTEHYNIIFFIHGVNQSPAIQSIKREKMNTRVSDEREYLMLMM
ncbi:hypothetical protein Q8G47_28055, partial [Klebsiella pneumoniae]